MNKLITYAVVLLCFYIGFAQELEHEVTVTLKLIQVHVTDESGNPIIDLEKSDFALSDNGEEKPITEFERYVLSVPEFKTEVPDKELSPLLKRMNRKFFLFFDFAFNNMTGIKTSKKAALYFLANQIKPDDEVGVLSYSQLKGLTLHEYLTKDHRRVRQVVGGFGAKEILGRVENVESEYWQRMFGFQPVDASKQGSMKDPTGQLSRILSPVHLDRFIEDPELMEYRYHANFFSMAIQKLSKALRYIPGNKEIILFSSGIASSLLYGTRSAITSESMGDVVSRKRYEEMIKDLAASNSRIYSLNSEENRALLNVHPDALGDHSLQRLSIDTGGRYFDHVHDYKKAFTQIDTFTSSYYVLGYYIDETWDGQYHEIKVKLKRKGCQVYAQRGYYNPKPFTEFTDLEKQIHLIDLALSDKPHFQDAIQFPMITQSCLVEDIPHLGLIAEIPGERLKELSGEAVEIACLIFNEEDNIVGEERIQVDFKGFIDKTTYYHTLLPVFPGEYNCRLVIRNIENGMGARAVSSAVVEPKIDHGIQLFTPLLLMPESDIYYLRGSTAKNQKRGNISFFYVYPFDYTRYRPLMQEMLKGANTILVIISCLYLEIPEPEINITMNLRNDLQGKIIPLALEELEQIQNENQYTYFFELNIQEVPVGNYELEIHAEETTTQAKSQIKMQIKVR